MRSTWSTWCALLLLTRARAEPCAALRGAWQSRLDELEPPSRIEERSMFVDGAALSLEVWGAGGAARAAAAALHVLLRVALGYRAHLRVERADLCYLARAERGRAGLAAVAPAAAWPALGSCGATRGWALDELTSLAEGARAAAATAPLLLAWTPDPACAARAALWPFYANGTADATSCAFELASDGRFVVLARSDSASADDASALAELRRRAAARFQPRLYATDVAFRRDMARRRRGASAFLFVDDDIWGDEPLVVRVQPPPCAPGDATAAACALALRPADAVRVGNGVFMHAYAPAVAAVVSELDFEPAHLRAILTREAEQWRPEPNITEAACHWALGSVDFLFDKIMKYKRNATAQVYRVAVYPCADDPDVTAHATAAAYLRDPVLWYITQVDLRYEFKKVNCSDEHALADAVARGARDRYTCAAVAWSAAPGARKAAVAAHRAFLPLLLVGAAPEPSEAARAPSGRIADVACAYRRLLELCEWSRIAVLSDRSAYSDSFAEALLAEREFTHRSYALDAHGVASSLRELRADDARVVFVNAAWPLAEAVLCEARRDGLAAQRVWLVREARTPTCAGGWAGLRVLSLGVSWRGGEAARGGCAKLREGLRNKAWPPGAALGPPLTAALVDALMQVTLAFDKFLRERPSQRNDLRGSVSDLTSYLDELNATGVAGALQSDDFALKEPAVYVEQWSGGRGRVVAVWRVARGVVRQEWPRRAPTCAEPARDRPACATVIAGDAFAPRCLDAPLFASAAFLLLGALALCAARRARLARRRRREGAWRRRLEEQRRRAAAALGAFLVERGAIRLLHEIGSGCYGRVHCAELRRGGATLLVAAKEPRADAAPAEEGALLREALLLAPLAHAHVVRLLGVCVADGPPTLLLEHACHLDLQRYLAERRARAAAGACRELGPRALTRLARQAAGALRYLAARRVVHRDVRAANCLVDARRALKLADFGLARALGAAEPEYATTRRGLFPVLWMAPESLAHGVFSGASDVWALGVLLLELATLGARPYGSWAPAAVLRYVAAGGHPPLPPDLCTDTREVVLACWQRAPERRPSAARVADALAARPAAVRAAFLPPLLPAQPPPPHDATR